MLYRSPHPRVTIPNVSLAELILARAERYGEKPALIDGPSGRTWTFNEFRDRVRSIAGGLDDMGFRKGDVMAVLCPNCPEYGMVFLAVALLGGVNTTLNPTSTRSEIQVQAADSGADFLFSVPELLENATSGTHWRGLVVLGEASDATSLSALMESNAQAGHAAINPARDVVVLPYSSGTTGMSKGVQLTHRNLVANLCQIADGIFTGEDTIVGLAPFFHIYGLTVVLLLGLYLGATDVILPRFETHGFVEAIERYGVTHANLVPPLILALAKHSSLDSDRLSSLRRVQSGAAPLSSETALAFRERFDCEVFQGYGLTETSPVTHLAPRTSGTIPIESIGPPVAETECRILDLETGRELGPHKRGELYVRGPQVMRGYLREPEKTAQMIDSEGWLKTGDIAYADEEGNFYIVDRAKELIKYKAHAIAPAELEAVLLSHPRVADAAVVPNRDEAAGEIPKAFVVPRAQVDAAELMSWVASRVAPHKKVRRLEFVSEIPRSTSGKILRRILTERDRAHSASKS